MIRLSFLFLLFFSVPVLHAEEAAGEPLRFCNSHWPPYSYGDADGQAVGGYAVDFINEIARRIERPVQLHILPWLRCLKMAEDGTADGIMLLTENDERKHFLVMSTPLIWDANLLWYRGDNPKARARLNFAELQGLRIGVVTGFNYGESFNSAVEQFNLTLDDAPSIVSNFKRLERGWIDVFLVNRMAGEYSLHDYPQLKSRLVAQQGPFEEVGFRIGLAKTGRGAGLIDQFDQAIRDMLQDGTVVRIMSSEPFDYL